MQFFLLLKVRKAKSTETLNIRGFLRLTETSSRIKISAGGFVFRRFVGGVDLGLCYCAGGVLRGLHWWVCGVQPSSPIPNNSKYTALSPIGSYWKGKPTHYHDAKRPSRSPITNCTSTATMCTAKKGHFSLEDNMCELPEFFHFQPTVFPPHAPYNTENISNL